jgi:hypothetical protein
MSRPPLFQIDFFLRLPFDVRLDGATLKRPDFDVNRSDLGPIPGWEDVTLDPSTTVAPVVPQSGVWPSTTLNFRRVTERVRHPVHVMWDAFGSEMAAGLPRWKRALNAHRRAWARFRLKERTTCTMIWMARIDSPSERHIVEDQQLANEWVIDEFETGLRYLNEFLTALHVVTEDPALGPIHRLDLGPLIGGFQTDLRARAEGRKAAKRPIMFSPHSNIPSPKPILSDSDVRVALELLPDPTRPRPFLAVFEFMVAARRALGKGQNAQAVVEATTSIEVLVNVVIRVVGPQKDSKRYHPTTLPNILEAGFKNKVLDHLVILLGVPRPDLNSEGDQLGRWWQRCYLLRNEIVHQGHRPTDEEALRAVEASAALSGWIGDRMEHDPVIGTRFHWTDTLAKWTGRSAGP